MRDYVGNNVLRHLTRPIYVIRMGWYRWGDDAKLRWLYILREACLETLDDIALRIQDIERTRK